MITLQELQIYLIMSLYSLALTRWIGFPSLSRSYDLTRHEDTIHNSRKQKVRCHLCTEKETFSSNDALTQNTLVVHPDVDFPGKLRRGRKREGADVVRQKIEGGRGGR